MNTDHRIRTVIKERMQASQTTQQDLANALGIKQPSVAAVLSGKRGTIPQSLLDVLDALGLELCVRVKESNETAS